MAQGKIHGKRGRSQRGNSNSNWKGGRSKTFRRRVTKARPGQVVHHKNRKKTDNRPSNFQKMSPGQHNKVHPNRGKGKK